MVPTTILCGAGGVGRKRWGKPRHATDRRKRGAGSSRYVRRERSTLWRDPKTGVWMQIGPDHGSELREHHQLGLVKGKRIGINDAGRPYMTEGSYAVGTSVIDALRATGCLSITQAGLLCRSAGVNRRIISGYEFRTDRGRVDENDKAMKARKKLQDRALRLGTERFNRLIEVLVLDLRPDDRRLVRFLRALDAYADLLRLAAAQEVEVR
jgi:hypothetical protein